MNKDIRENKGFGGIGFKPCEKFPTYFNEKMIKTLCNF